MQYVFETHCHTDESSRCGRVKGADVVRMYKEAGYAGIVITDHFNSYTFDQAGLTAWQDMIDHHMAGYRAAKALEDESFTVLYGLELRFEKENDNDYLVFGADEAYLRAHPFLCYQESYTDFYLNAKTDGLIVFQAHPFRSRMQVVKPQYLDGIEVFNGNKRHDSRCEIALQWAMKYGLPMLSGSDFHQPEDLARGGIVTDRRIRTMDDLLSVLREKRYAMKYSFDFETKEIR